MLTHSVLLHWFCPKISTSHLARLDCLAGLVGLVTCTANQVKEELCVGSAKYSKIDSKYQCEQRLQRATTQAESTGAIGDLGLSLSMPLRTLWGNFVAVFMSVHTVLVYWRQFFSTVRKQVRCYFSLYANTKWWQNQVERKFELLLISGLWKVFGKNRSTRDVMSLVTSHISALFSIGKKCFETDNIWISIE